jgi:hypothetical protein
MVLTWLEDLEDLEDLELGELALYTSAQSLSPARIFLSIHL